MTDRERLIQLLVEMYEKYAVNLVLYFTDEEAAIIADKLLAQGVIVPPVKVGDKVWYYDYVPTTKGLERIIRSSEVSQITIDSQCSFVTLVNCISLALENFGKTVFLTREEAEAALEKLGTED